MASPGAGGALTVGPTAATTLAASTAAPHARSSEHPRVLDNPPAAAPMPTTGMGPAIAAGPASMRAVPMDDLLPAPSPVPPSPVTT
jgi:hypothetical protein